MSKENIQIKPKPEADENGEGEKVKLERTVGLVSGIGLTMGTMIGSGIFATAPGVVEYSGSIGLSLIIWVACGLIAILGAISYCELCTMITKSGGEYQYLYEAFGPIPAFLFCWTAVVVLRPATVAAIAMTFSTYLGILINFFHDASRSNGLLLIFSDLDKILEISCKIL